jgi:D-alanyl-D-alanine carboxypeptidase
MNRREFLGTSAATAVAASGFLAVEGFTENSSSDYKPGYKALDRFVEQYLRAMNAPGLTLALADRDGVQRVVTYGFTDVGARRRVKPDELFQIGSISKSFLAICLLQLGQEGKLDLHRPITEYLPWFRM